MKAKNESATKLKGNNPVRRARESAQPDSASDGAACPREQMVAEAAYFRAEQRGFASGDELSDWFQAEADVDGLLKSGR